MILLPLDFVIASMPELPRKIRFINGISMANETIEKTMESKMQMKYKKIFALYALR
jgi:hypothetical protein